MILAIKTSTPTAQLILLENGKNIAEKTWEAGRQLARQLPGELEDFLKANNLSWEDLKGIVIFRGPGSFTGLRIGITVANAVAYAQEIPVVGAELEDWVERGIKRLAKGENDKIVLPEYGSQAHITKPKK